MTTTTTDSAGCTFICEWHAPNGNPLLQGETRSHNAQQALNQAIQAIGIWGTQHPDQEVQIASYMESEGSGCLLHLHRTTPEQAALNRATYNFNSPSAGTNIKGNQAITNKLISIMHPPETLKTLKGPGNIAGIHWIPGGPYIIICKDGTRLTADTDRIIGSTEPLDIDADEPQLALDIICEMAEALQPITETFDEYLTDATDYVILNNVRKPTDIVGINRHNLPA